MGLYLNPGNEAFRQAVADELYIDKTNLISQIDQKLNKSRTKHLCVSRRHFLTTINSPYLHFK